MYALPLLCWLAFGVILAGAAVALMMFLPILAAALFACMLLDWALIRPLARLMFWAARQLDGGRK